MPAKNHNRGKGRFGNPNDDNLGKKPSVTNSSIISSDAPSGSAASVYGQDSNTSVEKPGLYSHRRHMGEPTTQKLDSNDGSEQVMHYPSFYVLSYAEKLISEPF